MLFFQNNFVIFFLLYLFISFAIGLYCTYSVRREEEYKVIRFGIIMTLIWPIIPIFFLFYFIITTLGRLIIYPHQWVARRGKDF